MFSCSTDGDVAKALANDAGDALITKAKGTPAAASPITSRLTDVPASTFLTSARLWYRAPDAADAPLLTAWLNDRRVRRTTSPRFPAAEESARRWIEKQNPFERGKANDHAVFVFGLKGTREPIGKAALFAINWIDRNAEFGISISPGHWNQGYGREVACQMLEYGFHELNLHRIELHVNGVNPGGIKAYEAAGFVHEGTKRQASFVDGRWDDIWMMGALRDEWSGDAISAK